METIRMGGLVLEFLQDKVATSGGADIFRMIVEPDAKVPAPHYHENWDETVYGLSGTLSFRMDGKDVSIGPGDSLFIARGVPHGFRNDSGGEAVCLCVLTPGVLGPQYFRDIAALLEAGGPPDRDAVLGIMNRYGLVPAAA